MESLIRKADTIIDALNKHIKIGNNRYASLMLLHLMELVAIVYLLLRG